MMAGRKYLDRDARGWRVPRRGTQRYLIYQEMAAGLSQTEIARKLRLGAKLVAQEIHKIRYPDVTTVKRPIRRTSKKKLDPAIQWAVANVRFFRSWYLADMMRVRSQKQEKR